ncbi:hypothetical protein B0H21DRAFT_820393 [Amylocystis lapponica]|nr:hypothetical protein B0H21DRAFT_820393 [Amylocystis lapponica]
MARNSKGTVMVIQDDHHMSGHCMAEIPAAQVVIRDDHHCTAPAPAATPASLAPVPPARASAPPAPAPATTPASLAPAPPVRASAPPARPPAPTAPVPPPPPPPPPPRRWTGFHIPRPPPSTPSPPPPRPPGGSKKRPRSARTPSPSPHPRPPHISRKRPARLPASESRSATPPNSAARALNGRAAATGPAAGTSESTLAGSSTGTAAAPANGAGSTSEAPAASHPNGEAAQMGRGSPERVTRKEGETNTKKLKKRGSRNNQKVGVIAGLHLQHIKKAAEEGINRQTRKKKGDGKKPNEGEVEKPDDGEGKKLDKGETKNAAAAGVSTLPAEVVKWTSKEGAGAVMCAGARCVHPLKFDGGAAIVIRHEPSVNINGHIRTHAKYYHWKCTTPEQRVRFQRDENIHVSEQLPLKVRDMIRADIAKAKVRKTRKPQTTDNARQLNRTLKRRRREQEKREEKKAKKLARAELRAAKGKERVIETDDDAVGSSGEDEIDELQSGDHSDDQEEYIETERPRPVRRMSIEHDRFVQVYGGRLFGYKAPTDRLREAVDNYSNPYHVPGAALPPVGSPRGGSPAHASANTVRDVQADDFENLVSLGTDMEQ